MVDKLKQAVPLAVAFGCLVRPGVEISLTSAFQLFDNGDRSNGIGRLPRTSTWLHRLHGCVHHLGAVSRGRSGHGARHQSPSRRSFGATAGLVPHCGEPATADLPDFWCIAAVGSGSWDSVQSNPLPSSTWYYSPAFPCRSFTAVGFWCLVNWMDVGEKSASVAA